MKKTLTIILVFFTLMVSGQNKLPKDLGIGFAIAADPYQYEDSSIPEELYSNKELTNKLELNAVYPFFLKPDYGLYHFICLEKTVEYYKILINDNDIAYIPNDSNYYYQTWETILSNSVLERQTENNPIRTESNSNSKIVKNNCEVDRLNVINILEKNSEYWIQISFYSDCDVAFLINGTV